MSEKQQWFFVDISGREHGPIPERELLHRLRSRELPSSTKVRVEGRSPTSAVSAHSIPYLRERLHVRGPSRRPTFLAAHSQATDLGEATANSPESTKKSSLIRKALKAVGYASLALVGVLTVVWFAADVLGYAIGFGLWLILAPLGFFVSLLLSSALGAILALPLRIFLDQERWESVAVGISVVVWILLGILLAISS